jgi:acetyltransferase
MPSSSNSSLRDSPISKSKLPRHIRNLDAVFEPKSVAVIGASREPNKIGHVILRNFIEGGFAGPVYPINPHADEILGLSALKRTSDAPGVVDCALIAVPAPFVVEALQDSIRAGARAAVVITGGFSEVGNPRPEEEMAKLANDHDLALIGPNCMGVLNPAARVDSVFLPIYKMGRPHSGGISFISQSGAVGGCIVDLAARSGMGMAKFVSYGNAAVITETDLLQYLAQDDSTRVVVNYLEGVRDGRAFLQAATALTTTKPLVVLKAGTSRLGAAAAASHTGALAGSNEVYSAAFRQSGACQARTLDELFDLAKVFSMPLELGQIKKTNVEHPLVNLVHPSAHPNLSHSQSHTPRIGIITNGGGNGVLAADSIEKEGLALSEFTDHSRHALAAMLPTTSRVHNPLDLIGDADAARYDKALQILLEDPTIDALVIIVLFQTAALDSTIINILVRAAQTRRKPMVVVSTGGEYTELHRRILDSYGIPTYSSPSSAVRALSQFMEYARRLKN